MRIVDGKGDLLAMWLVAVCMLWKVPPGLMIYVVYIIKVNWRKYQCLMMSAKGNELDLWKHSEDQENRKTTWEEENKPKLWM